MQVLPNWLFDQNKDFWNILRFLGWGGIETVWKF